jgi:hypothetical protein
MKDIADSITTLLSVPLLTVMGYMAVMSFMTGVIKLGYSIVFAGCATILGAIWYLLLTPETEASIAMSSIGVDVGITLILLGIWRTYATR